mmetsp:Transcript_13471/g.43877  ORF Transcript_13471/g.43877 Transcript_13471/m.43877 type:complete len:202 (+) Transcript_13471:949-1554(+)
MDPGGGLGEVGFEVLGLQCGFVALVLEVADREGQAPDLVVGGADFQRDDVLEAALQVDVRREGVFLEHQELVDGAVDAAPGVLLEGLALLPAEGRQLAPRGGRHGQLGLGLVEPPPALVGPGLLRGEARQGALLGLPLRARVDLRRFREGPRRIRAPRRLFEPPRRLAEGLPGLLALARELQRSRLGLTAPTLRFTQLQAT